MRVGLAVTYCYVVTVFSMQGGRVGIGVAGRLTDAEGCLLAYLDKRLLGHGERPTGCL